MPSCNPRWKPATLKRASRIGGGSAPKPTKALDPDYFRIRDFEYVQPLYDLSFFLEIGALSKGIESPKYRVFSLWRAALSLDSYGTTVDRWLDGDLSDKDLDHVPSSRIRQYLKAVRKTGTVSELRNYRSDRFQRCLRLRSLRGLGPANIALTVSSQSLSEEWLEHAVISLNLQRERITDLSEGRHSGPWQTAHIVPPLLRFLRHIENNENRAFRWSVDGIADPFVSIDGEICVGGNISAESLIAAARGALKDEKLFRGGSLSGDSLEITHQMGWRFLLKPVSNEAKGMTIARLIEKLDPIGSNSSIKLKSDLHLHTAWSDGAASINTMASAAVHGGLKYIAVTDHSRSSKLQGGLTPVTWIRQANALTLAKPVCPVLHGVEVDIHRDGTLDQPPSLLAAADIVVASVHSAWSDDANENTQRLIRAIESGLVDILAHPTSTIVGKPGVPDWFRAPARVHWDDVFACCVRWRVALEMNCFPSRLDLSLGLLAQAVRAGCAISFGSDAHARSHLLNLRFADAALRRLPEALVLNRLSYPRLMRWISSSRAKRQKLTKSATPFVQSEFTFDVLSPRTLITARIQRPRKIPDGSCIVGIDLTAGSKATGVAIINGRYVETCSVSSDTEILDLVKKHRPEIVSIDSPLGLPGGGDVINRNAGIVRVAEQDLASIGIPAYPALIDSMERLTLRGIRLRKTIEALSRPPRVIESYPGAAQDILCIPRKQRSLDLLREGLERLGLRGRGLKTTSHDEMDAITSAVVGRYFETGDYVAMGIPSEAQLIVPKVYPVRFADNPILCLAGRTGAGKSVVARYLSVFYGFKWIQTRDIIREIVIEDMQKPRLKRLFAKTVDPAFIDEQALREFGMIILREYKQVPLRKKLMRLIMRTDAPLVVDSIRAITDVNRSSLVRRHLITWFVDCPDTVINSRLTVRPKLGGQRIRSASPVDETANQLYQQADVVIPNSGSLEELRWCVDDTLFARLITLC
jgi:histidinol phosphatase-like PHP family hydrolase/predicted nuclease with RNAse H fold/dephospho-CoA kinase